MAVISRIKIKNFKCFGDEVFEMQFKEKLNIIVGDNEEGKSTVIEAVHAALTTMYHGKSIKQQLSQYLFNKHTVEEYLAAINNEEVASPPEIVIEVWFKNNKDTVIFEGDGNSEKANKACGIRLEIKIEEELLNEYRDFVSKNKPLRDLPIEYYGVKWWSFARDRLTTYSQSVKSIMVDSSNYLLQNGSDLYISHIIRESLDKDDKMKISQEYRNMQNNFDGTQIMKDINKKLNDDPSPITNSISIGLNKGVAGDWDKSMLMHIDSLPFNNKGRGKQCYCKTMLALSKESAKNASVVLLEEPENHLSFSSLGELMDRVSKHCEDKQIIITTHSSFVANKLGLDSLILIKNKKQTDFANISKETTEFFRKMPGYDTLRFILCNACILVEGDADELIVQKAYMQSHNRKLPIQDGIDVISVGGSAKRYLEIAEKLRQRIAVLIDTDGDIQAVRKKYEKYLKSPSIKICYSRYKDAHKYIIREKEYNDWTLEPELIRANTPGRLMSYFGTHFSLSEYPDVKPEDALRLFMKNNKTKCALLLFELSDDISVPEYIQEAVDYVKQ